MQKWEYMVVDLIQMGRAEYNTAVAEGGNPGSAFDTFASTLNRFGADGWMLADIMWATRSEVAEGCVLGWLMRPVAD